MQTASIADASANSARVREPGVIVLAHDLKALISQLKSVARKLARR